MKNCCIEYKNKLLKGITQNHLISIVLFFILGKLLYMMCYGILLHQHKISYGPGIDNYCQWDCGWYRSIIYSGYDLVPHPSSESNINGQANWAFFPLFPLISKALLKIFHTEISILIFNQILLLASMIVLYTYCKKNYSEKIALCTILYLGISSENIYLFSLYSESLFIFLSVVTIYLVSKDKYYLSGFFCALLSATRIVGFAMMLPMMFNYVRANKNKLNAISTILLSTFSLSGLLAFMFYLYIHCNDWLAFYHIQSAWGRFTHSWLKPYNLSLGGSWIDQLLAIVSVPLLYFFYKKRKYNEFIFFGVCFIIPIYSQNLTSFSRFFFANFASYIFLAACSVRNFRYFLCIGGFILSLNIYCTFSWLTGAWMD